MCGMLGGLLLSAVLIEGKIYFSETFGEGWQQRWRLSTWKEGHAEKMGKWQTSAGKWYRDEVEDAGLQTAEIMKFYAISASFEPFSNEGKELIVQYQAKYEKDLACGGGYLKLGPSTEDLSKFGDSTKYNIMFGPDQCNAEKRTHLIFRYGGRNFLKKAELPYKQEGEGLSHLYTLHLKPDNTVRVLVDLDKIYEGSLKDDWEMLPPREIADPKDQKPSDWLDEEMMEDPADVKPPDWVESKMMVDPKAGKPEEWDDEEDGEWDAPKIENPNFKGPWLPRKIPNPDYKGTWKARIVPNPDFSDDPDLYKYSDIGYVGFDVWQVKGGTIFDNIIITDSLKEAEDMAQKWKALREVEDAAKKNEDEAQAKAFEKAKAARAARSKENKAGDTKNEKKDEL
ncbi:unnamed protein product [Durusdinium trenchii]|uniref:Calreticulin n=2 Tax=Durusdinium trenchii TaxID=1381693 RepID=A0ABP0RPZ6_9DINO